MNQSDISTALKAATKLSGSGAAQTYIPGRTDFQDNHINFSSKGMSIQHKSGYVSPYNGAEVTSSNFHQVRNESIEVLKNIFHSIDTDNSGKISSSELNRALTKLNLSISQSAIDIILAQGDFNANREVDFNEFVVIMLPVFTGKFEDNQLWHAFRKFDTDNSGYITVDELRQVLLKIGQNFTNDQLIQVLRSADVNYDGKLDFEEFRRFMTAGY